jgi:DNA-directed RNA polymerase subunit beta'
MLKQKCLKHASIEVDEVWENYNMGLITNNERYNQIIDVWSRVDTRVTETLIKEMAADKQGFNSVYMMLDSGARGSKQQIKQLSGIRGLMAKPRKSGEYWF